MKLYNNRVLKHMLYMHGSEICDILNPMSGPRPIVEFVWACTEI